MEREMKYHIYNTDHEPLCYDDRALEFNTFRAAMAFLKSFETDDNIIINEDILYYDGGDFDATGYVYDAETNELMEVEDNAESK